MKRENAIEPRCALCEHAELLADTDYCLCRRKGVIAAYASCRRFSPDLTRLAPARRVPLSRDESADYTL